MEKTTKQAADDVNNHREDGEEAMKHTSKVVPIDAGRNSASVQRTPVSEPSSEKNKAVPRESK